VAVTTGIADVYNVPPAIFFKPDRLARILTGNLIITFNTMVRPCACMVFDRQSDLVYNRFVDVDVCVVNTINKVLENGFSVVHDSAMIRIITKIPKSTKGRYPV
jgi:hypothetical protein